VIRISSILFVTTFFFFTGCATTVVHVDNVHQNYKPSGKNAVQNMISAVTAINGNSPQSYTVDFYVEGISDKSRFKAHGRAQFDRERGLMQVTFADYIFQSPVALLFLDGEEIRIFYPIEKKLFIDNSKTINIANYTGIGIDFKILYDLATGTIRLLQNYAVREGLTATEGSGSMLILENPESVETISFNGAVPDKILFINKNTRYKAEIYFKKFIVQGESRFFSRLKIIAERNRLQLDITFNKVLLNTPVKVKTIKDIKLPPDLQVVKM